MSIIGTCEQVSDAAKAAGFTHVQTMAGLTPLDAWAPYGKRAGHNVIEFRLDDSEAFILEGSVIGYTGGLLGRWPLSSERITLTGLGWLVATEGN